MSFTPASSIPPAVVTVAGTVAVSNFPASQAVTGPLTDAELRAADVSVRQGAGGTAWAVVQATVPWVVDGSGATVPVSVQGQPILVDGSAVTQPVSVDSLPLPDGAATEASLAVAAETLNDVGLTAILERERMETTE